MSLQWIHDRGRGYMQIDHHMMLQEHVDLLPDHPGECLEVDASWIHCENLSVDDWNRLNHVFRA